VDRRGVDLPHPTDLPAESQNRTPLRRKDKKHHVALPLVGAGQDVSPGDLRELARTASVRRDSRREEELISSPRGPNAWRPGGTAVDRDHRRTTCGHSQTLFALSETGAGL